MQTKYELNELYLQNADIGGFGNVIYRSSTETDSEHTWAQDFDDGEEGLLAHFHSFLVGAVRAF